GAGHRIAVCRGGATRQESVAAGITRLPATVDLVLIHDAARPLVTPELIRQGIAMARQHGSAVAAIPVVDTIKQVDPEGRVLATPDRATLYAAQTPQVFRRDWLAAAYKRARDLPVTDEASLLELAGLPVYIYPGSPENLKLTTPIDLLIAEALLSERASRYAG
ncbi:IspD/TarI family cytidylyltransferase, partial [Nitrolancea hollandica]|uniref:IspD/TarI family cytidylyltransferase n=1 Tax=Nitrolancea hollandica TaxID=1206749 RepID=UPI000590B667